jgi:hypothetical protein
LILIFEHDLRVHDGQRFRWRPSWFSAPWRDGRTWRLMWGLWSFSYYPEAGLHEFLRRIEAGKTRWIDRPGQHFTERNNRGR